MQDVQIEYDEHVAHSEGQFKQALDEFAYVCI